MVLCVWLTKCVANSVADCKETNRKSRRRLGDALEGGPSSTPSWDYFSGFCAVQNALGLQTHTVLDLLPIYMCI